MRKPLNKETEWNAMREQFINDITEVVRELKERFASDIQPKDEHSTKMDMMEMRMALGPFLKCMKKSDRPHVTLIVNGYTTMIEMWKL